MFAVCPGGERAKPWRVHARPLVFMGERLGVDARTPRLEKGDELGFRRLHEPVRRLFEHYRYRRSPVHRTGAKSATNPQWSLAHTPSTGVSNVRAQCVTLS